MKAPRINRSLVTLLAVCFLFVPAAHGQLAGRVSGMVVDAFGGVIPGASVTLFSEDHIRTAKTDQYGRFDFQNLPEGLDDLEVSSPGFGTVTRTDLQTRENGLYEIVLTPGSFSGMTCGVRPDLAAANEITSIPFKTFKLVYEKSADSVSVSGIIRDAWDGPLEKVIVTMTRPRGADPAYTARTNHEGQFEFRSVEPGRYTLTATYDNYFEFSATMWATLENLTKFDHIYLVSRKIEYPCDQGF